MLFKIALTKIPKVGAVTARQLISYCGSAEAVFQAKKKNLLKIPGVGESVAEQILQKKVLQEAEKEIEFIDRHQIKALFYTDKEYPYRLKNQHDAPLILFYKGTADLNHPRTVGIVGTRQPTPYGKTFCEELVEGLKAYNPLIISGLAYGIDITAHRKCLQENLESIGVLGHGLGRIYPSDHRATAEKMLSMGGLLTEYASDVQPDREHFPMRNRIIAALSDAVIVVETDTRGGSVITAELANQYNKDVFALPGKITDKFSRGCNHLIKTHKAALIESAADVAYIMRWEAEDQKKEIQTQLFVDLSPLEQEAYSFIQGNENIGIDQLSQLTSLTSSELAALLLELEFKGLIRSLPGKRYASM